MGQAILGGSSSSSSNKSGYSALSPELQAFFNPFAAATNYYTLPSFGAPNTTIPGVPGSGTIPGVKATAAAGGNAGGGNAKGGNGRNTGGGTVAPPAAPTMGGSPNVASMFTPEGVQGIEQGAINNIQQGFAPTASSLQNNINMQMNPYNSSVINQINQAAQGQNSILNQNLQAAGQFGSNRQALGANDISQTTANTIGSFLQNQYNTSLNNALTTIPGLQNTDAQNQLGVGSFLRNLQMQQQQAPITALQTGTQLMSPFISGGSGSSGGSSSGGLLPAMANLAAAIP